MLHRVMMNLPATLLLLVLGTACVQAVEYETEVVAEGLEFPWSLAFLPNGDMLVTERAGRLRLISNGELLPQAIEGVPDVYVKSQAGLFDVVLDPDFENNSQLYLSFAQGTDKANSLTIVRAKLSGKRLESVKSLFSSTPPRATPAHYGGRIIFLPDGTLLTANGDGYSYREQAQSLDNHYGKAIRINTDGSIPGDNPFVGVAGALPEIWSYGHRNPQALVRNNNTVYMHEHGAQGGDELNIIEPGNNYGWPAITYSMDYTGAIISPYQEKEGMEQPLLFWTPSIAPAGMAVYNGDAFPGWRDNLFVAALAEQSIRRLTIKNGAVVDQEVMFTDLGSRMRDVRAGPDGYLYLLTDKADGQVIRVKPGE